VCIVNTLPSDPRISLDLALGPTTARLRCNAFLTQSHTQSTRANTPPTTDAYPASLSSTLWSFSGPVHSSPGLSLSCQISFRTTAFSRPRRVPASISLSVKIPIQHQGLLPPPSRSRTHFFVLSKITHAPRCRSHTRAPGHTRGKICAMGFTRQQRKKKLVMCVGARCDAGVLVCGLHGMGAHVRYVPS
jgi:hypothetical protein